MTMNERWCVLLFLFVLERIHLGNFFHFIIIERQNYFLLDDYQQIVVWVICMFSWFKKKKEKEKQMINKWEGIDWLSEIIIVLYNFQSKLC